MSSYIPAALPFIHILGLSILHVFFSIFTDVLPKECDVISVWISKFDQARGEKRKVSEAIKHEVIEDIVQSLIFIWQSQNLPILPAQRIKDEVIKLTGRTEYIAKNTRKIGDKEWIKEQYDLFNNIFDIGIKSKPGPKVKASYRNKRKAEDLDLSVCNISL